MAKIENLDHIHVNSNKSFYEYKDYSFTLQRVNNDVWGNPMYRIELSKNYEYITEKLKGLATRTYVSKNYALIQSYNLSDSLKRIFDKLESKTVA